MTTRYTFDSRQSRFTVQSFATGMLARLGHNPTFAVRDFSGFVLIDGQDVSKMSLELVARADALELLDQVKPGDRDEIVGRMRREVLETSGFPEIAFRSVEVASEPGQEGRYLIFVGGRLTLHGVTQPHGTDAEILVAPDKIRLRGGSTLRMSSYQIRPVTALAGAIKLKDELKVTFDLVAVAEAPTS